MPPARTTRPFCTPASGSATLCSSPTRPPWTAGCGPTSSKSRTPRRQGQEGHRVPQEGHRALQGLAELIVFYWERAAGFRHDVGLQDESYFDALVRMFGQALKAIAALSAEHRSALWERLDAVRRISHDVGYGVCDDMDELLAQSPP